MGRLSPSGLYFGQGRAFNYGQRLAQFSLIWHIVFSIHIYIHTHIHIYIYIHICIHTYVYIYIYIHIYIYTDIRVYIYIYTYIYIHTWYTHIHIHIYVHTYIYLTNPPFSCPQNPTTKYKTRVKCHHCQHHYFACKKNGWRCRLDWWKGQSSPFAGLKMGLDS